MNARDYEAAMIHVQGLRAESKILRADNARLRELLHDALAVKPCEYAGDIACVMIPTDTIRRSCFPCQARAALAKGGE